MLNGREDRLEDGRLDESGGLPSATSASPKPSGVRTWLVIVMMTRSRRLTL
ncbi:MAG: hypothetical protein ACREXS_14190 [Gammaproteobacteria bacterium]